VPDGKPDRPGFATGICAMDLLTRFQNQRIRAQKQREEK